MTKRLIFIILFLVFMGVGLVGLLGTKGMQFSTMAKAAESAFIPPTTISTFEAETQTWGESLRSVGSIEPIQGIIIEAESSGQVDSINFENGQEVSQGDLLVQQDIDVELAQLKSAEATATLARIEFDRATKLRESGSVAQNALDAAIADLDRANAEVENIKAVIDRKTITAPFDGRVGIRQINLGQFVTQGSPVVALQSYDQVYVNFTLPQQALSTLEVGFPLVLTTDAFPEIEFKGSVTAVSPEIDPATRTIEVQGTLDNPDGKLRAGLFVRTEVVLPKEHDVIAIPSTAVLYAPYGNSVYKVVEDEETGSLIAKQFFVRLGSVRGDFVSVIKGVDLGDSIVSNGAFKLRNGAPVNVDNTNTPEPELAPNPGNS